MVGQNGSRQVVQHITLERVHICAEEFLQCLSLEPMIMAQLDVMKKVLVNVGAKLLQLVMERALSYLTPDSDCISMRKVRYI